MDFAYWWSFSSGGSTPSSLICCPVLCLNTAIKRYVSCIFESVYHSSIQEIKDYVLAILIIATLTLLVRAAIVIYRVIRYATQLTIYWDPSSSRSWITKVVYFQEAADKDEHCVILQQQHVNF